MAATEDTAKTGKKNAVIGIAKCPATGNIYGVRLEEKADKKCWATWAFPIKTETARREGYLTTQFPSDILYEKEYPGCPYCKKFEDLVKIGNPGGRGPYTKWAGISSIPGVMKDNFGNAQGSQFDLAADNSFEGYKILVIFLCSGGSFKSPEKALRKKGFDIQVSRKVPPYNDLKESLRDCSQLWLISNKNHNLNGDHIKVITDFFNAGHGIYMWGDNDPNYVDANAVLKNIFQTEMSGNRHGDKVLGIQRSNETPGIVANHLITTGIESFDEGVTIAEIRLNKGLQPLIYGSENQIVTAYYDQNGKRALVDGGFTRLWYKWDSAGTDRYIVNAAAWLANIERFGYKNG